MPLVTAFDEVVSRQQKRELSNGHYALRTDFIERPEDKDKDTPMAFLAEGSPNRVLRSHFHVVDQFQVIYVGEGRLGTHDLVFGGVHFSRAYTPYGPIKYSDKGLGFITLRAHRDPGAQYMPEARPALDAVSSRTPWQLTVMPDFTFDLNDKPVGMKAIEGLKDDRGLSGYSMVMKPGSTGYSVDPSKGDGQYIVVMKGSILHEEKQKKGLTIIWVNKDEPPMKLEAGPDGAELIILNFPIPGGGMPDEVKAQVQADGKGAFKTYQCILCAFTYNEAEGHPDGGIAPGTRWADVPDSFNCPDCDASKVDFEMIEI